MEEENNNPQHDQYPVQLLVHYPEKSSRWLALATILFMVPKLVMLIPHLILLHLLNLVAFVAWIIGQFAVLFIGRYPKGLYDFVLSVLRWQTRVCAF